MSKSSLRALLFSAGVAALATPAAAQTAAPGGAGTAPTAVQGVTTTSASNAASSQPSAGATVAEIVVTANKREQNLNKVGLTVNVLGAQQLAQEHIVSLADLAQAIPGLVYSPSTANTPIFTLRGVGFNEAALGVYPAVSVYIDQAPLVFPVLASHSNYDLQRIEVLKGPQGTLFGENSTGGAINYITAKPTNTFAAGGDVTYGRFNDVEVNGYVSGPITDTLKGRIAISGQRTDDWQQGAQGEGTLGAQNWLAGRAILDWTPRDDLRFSLNLNGWTDTSDPQALQYAVYQPNFPGVQPALTAYPFTPETPRAADWGPTRPSSDRGFGQVALRGDYDVLHYATITSLTSYDYFVQKQKTDGDGGSLGIYDLIQNNGRIQSFNQELRIANTTPARFNWVVGGNYERSVAVEDQILFFPYSHVDDPQDLNIYETADQTAESFKNQAVFASGDYRLIGGLTLKGGLRYTDSRTDADLCGADAGDGRIDELFTLLGNLFSGTTVAPLGPKSCFPLNAQDVPGAPFIQTLHEHNLSWRAGLDEQLNPDLLLYTVFSRGYKNGSFPTIAASTDAQLAPVTQEEVTAYEGGFKWTLFGRKVQVNAAGFYYDYGDKQVRGKLNDPIFGLLDVLVNVPQSYIAGGELEAILRPIDGLTVDAGLTYLQSEVQQYSGYNVFGVFQNFAGVDLPFTPKFTYTLNADYRFQQTYRGGTPFVGLSVFGRTAEDAAFNGSGLNINDYDNGGFTGRAVTTDPYRIPGYATLDLRAGYEAAEHWRVTVFGKNVTNKYYITNVIPGADTSARFAGYPATWGVTIAYKY